MAIRLVARRKNSGLKRPITDDMRNSFKTMACEHSSHPEELALSWISASISTVHAALAIAKVTTAFYLPFATTRTLFSRLKVRSIKFDGAELCFTYCYRDPTSLLVLLSIMFTIGTLMIDTPANWISASCFVAPGHSAIFIFSRTQVVLSSHCELMP